MTSVLLLCSTSGAAFQHEGTGAVVGADSFTTVMLSGKALEAGNLTIRGCIVQLPGAKAYEIELPLLSEEEDHERTMKSIAHANDAQRPKYINLNHRLSVPVGKNVKGPGHLNPRLSQVATTVPPEPAPSRFLELTVVPTQPLIRIRRTSLTNGAVMLYDGETCVMLILLTNTYSLCALRTDLLFE